MLVAGVAGAWVGGLSMPKSDSAERLLKRLQKIERAHGRLDDIHTRILAQAEALGQLLKEAQALAGPRATPKATRSRPRPGAQKAAVKPTAGKAASAKRTTRKASAIPVTPAAKAASKPRPRRTPRGSSATTGRRAPRASAPA